MKQKMQVLGKSFVTVIDRVSVSSGVAAGIIMFMVALITVYEVIMRHIFNNPTTWVFTVSLFVMMWFPFLAAPLGMKEKRQITADFLVSRLSERTGAMLRVITYIISLVFFIVVGYYGLQMCVDAYQGDMTSIELLRYPMWLLYLAFPVTMSLGCLQVFRLIAEEVRQLSSKRLANKLGWKDDPRLILPLFITLIAFGVYLVQINHVAGIIFLALCLLLGGVPVSFALGCTGIAGLFLIYQGFESLPMVPVIVDRTFYNFVLLAVPMFIMGGVILDKCGVGERIYDFASKWVGALPGGLAVGTIIACAIFSAMVGVSTAVAAAIGLTAIPALISRGYSKEMAYGSVAGGALGILIPPSVGLIVYAYLTNSSVGTLFAAAVLPGFIVVALFSIYVIFACKRSGKYEKVSITWKARLIATKGSILGLLAPVIVLGGIYSGVFTPTEAAGTLVVYSMVIAFVYKEMSWTKFIVVIKEAAILGSMIMMIMAGAMVLTHVVGHLQVAKLIAGGLATANIAPWQAITGIVLLYIVLGMFLDGMSITVLTVPILFPLLPALGLDVISFGVVLMIFIEMALITPPVGLNIFMLKAITGDTLWPIVRGNIPFAVLMLVVALLLLFFPQIALWLPEILGA